MSVQSHQMATLKLIACTISAPKAFPQSACGAE